MRADRLLSLLNLLQTRGSLTARQLARELEVSERTIYRDLDALSAAGIPVYAERGPGGGHGLLESYRTNLTGLSSEEVSALFMLSIPAPLTQLGVGRELKGAFLKLAAALPAGQRGEEQRVRRRIHLDSSWWFQEKERPAVLTVIQQALWQDRLLRVGYRSPFETVVEQVVAPYGLVAKTNVWHLVAAQQASIRVLQVSRVTDAALLAEGFTRPLDFDLAAFWAAWCVEYEANQPHFEVRARISPDLQPWLHRYFGDRAREWLARAAPPDEQGWVELTLSFESFEEARARLLGLGRAVKIIQPGVLRQSVVDFAEQVLALYGPAPSSREQH